jgi:uncharacterized coiled-coil protein SlyX
VRGVRLCAGLALLCWLCSGISWADEYTGPALPAGWLPISTIELDELETIVTRQAETIERQETTLTTLSETIDRQQTTIEQLGTAFEEYESAAQSTIRRLTRELWITRGVAAAALAIGLYIAVK